MNVPIRRYWALLVNYLRPQWGQFSLLAVLLLGGIGLQILLPQITRSFLDTAMTDALSNQLVTAALAFIGLAIVQQIVTATTTYFGENVAWTATNALRTDLMRHVLRLEMRFHNNRTIGELIERLDSDISQLSEFFSRMVVLVIGNLLLVFGILAVLALEDWRMGIGFLGFAALALLGLASVRNIAIPFEKALRQANANLFGYLEERLAATEDIRANGAVNAMIGGLYPKQAAVLEHWRASSQRFWVINLVSGMIVTLGYCVAFVAGYTLFQAGAITLGTAYLILNYAILLNRPFQELTAQIDRLQNVGASVERVEELLNMTPAIQDGAGANLPKGALMVAFEGVQFGYNVAEPVLHDVDFRVEAGNVLGVLGRTGSGKTTLSRLISRLYDVDSGSIRLGGVDVRQFTLDELRGQVAVVTQDVQLFEASIRDNLTFFDDSIPDSRLIDTLNLLGLTDWYAALPNGLDTQVEAGGRNLSAGEAQLLAFARAFLRDPGLIILDEASARLDPATEAHIERAVDRLLEGRTGIVIAHRLRTVQRADHILILENGRILEYGERERLAADSNSRFYHLLQTGLEEVLS